MKEEEDKEILLLYLKDMIFVAIGTITIIVTARIVSDYLISMGGL